MRAIISEATLLGGLCKDLLKYCCDLKKCINSVNARSKIYFLVFRCINLPYLCHSFFLLLLVCGIFIHKKKVLCPRYLCKLKLSLKIIFPISTVKKRSNRLCFFQMVINNAKSWSVKFSTISKLFLP